MEVKYKTFIPYENKNLTLLTLDLINKIYLSDDPLHENYHPDRFDMDNQIAITLGFIDDSPVLLSTLYQRPNYKTGIARTMNRYWKHPSIRDNQFGKFIADSRINTLSIIPSHLQYTQDLTHLFVSIEGGAYRYLKFLSNKLSILTKLQWHAQKEQIDVTGTGSMQHIAYCSLDPIFSSKTSEKQEIFTVI